MEKSDISLTYETIFEILVREKNREELQKLSPSFLKDAVVYLEEKRRSTLSDKMDVFSIDEREKTRKQLLNIQKMLIELYERREKKIVHLALIKSKTPAVIIDQSVFLEEEKAFFEEVHEVFNSFRKNILHNVISGQPPILPLSHVKHDVPMPSVNDTKLVRFITPVPKFVGKELEVYGPFDEEDVANLPFDIADVLIKKGKAEEVIE